jgi:flagellar assembly factor FliW
VLLIGAAAQFLRKSSREITARPATFFSAGMLTVETKYFGPMEYSDDAVIRTPLGFPAFERETGFLLVQLPGQYPLVYLQSVTSPDVCFPAVPVRVADPDYRLELGEDDSRMLGVGTRPLIGEEVLCLALLAGGEKGGPTANLLAPVVVHIASKIGVQCVNAAGEYDCRQSFDEMVPA